MAKVRIDVPEPELERFCEKWKITELAFFGSVLRDDFRPDSDIDILVSFEPEAKHTLFNLVQMQDELQGIFRRKVHLTSRRGIEASRNYIRRSSILDSAEPVYGR